MVEEVASLICYAQQQIGISKTTITRC